METSAKETPITKSKRKRLRKSMKNNACDTVDVPANLSPQDNKKNEEEFKPEFVIKTKGFLRNEMRDRGVDEPVPPQERARSFFETLFCSSSDDDDDGFLYDFFGDSDESTDEDENWFKWYKNNARHNSSRRSGEQYKAEDVDGYVGDQDLDSVLNYIEGTPSKNKGCNNRRSSLGGSNKKKNVNSASTGGSAKKKGRSSEQNGGSTKKKDCKTERRGASEASPKTRSQTSRARRRCENMM